MVFGQSQVREGNDDMIELVEKPGSALGLFWSEQALGFHDLANLRWWGSLFLDKVALNRSRLP